MTPEFSAADPETWPVVLTPAHIGAIYQRSVGGILKACQLGRFIPAPYKKNPSRWRKADVLRDVVGTANFAKGAFRRAS